MNKVLADFPSGPGLSAGKGEGELSGLADLFNGTGRHEETETMLRQALAMNEGLMKEFPTQLDFQLGLAVNHINLSTLLHEASRLDEARKNRRRGGGSR